MIERPIILGHRGDRQSFKDNSLDGIKSAFDKGADGVEIDVFFRPDIGVYLEHRYIHDPAIERPKLEDVLINFAEKGKIQIDIKPPDSNAVKAVAELIKKYKVENYEITSKILPLLIYVREELPNALIGMLVPKQFVEKWMDEDIKDYMLMGHLNLARANSVWLSKPEGFWTEDRVKKYQNNGFRVNSHLKSSSKKKYQEIVALNINSCTADNLDVLKHRR